MSGEYDYKEHAAHVVTTLAAWFGHGGLRLRVRRVGKHSPPLPAYATEGSAGLDLCATEAAIVFAGEVRKIGTGFAVEIPPGYEGQIRPRSSSSQRGLHVALGTIDSDYRGEISLIVANLLQGEEAECGPNFQYGSVSPKRIKIEAGDRIAQLVISPVARMVVEEVDALSETDRGAGGFGSTGR